MVSFLENIILTMILYTKIKHNVKLKLFIFKKKKKKKKKRKNFFPFYFYDLIK